MELRLNEYQLPAPITFNYEELKAELEEKVSMYMNLVYTNEQIKEAKADRAKLNSLKKALNDERIRMEKEYLIPFNTFKAQVNEIIGIIDKPVKLIDKQVKEFEEKQKQEKREQIAEYFVAVAGTLPITLNQIFNERWLNTSFSMKSVQSEIDSRLEQVKKDLATLSDLPEFGFEATEVYKTTLDVNIALNEGRRLSEMAKRKAEERARAEEQERLAAEATLPDEKEVVNLPDDDKQGVTYQKPVPTKQWVKFQAFLTTAEALELKAFFEERHIEFKPV